MPASLARFSSLKKIQAQNLHKWLARLSAATFLSLLFSTPSTFAQTYPERPVNVLMPWGDGFPANSARIYAEQLSERYGQTFVVQSKPGAGGEVAAKLVISSGHTDGSTLLVTGSSITIRAVSSDKNADGERDLQPIAQLTTTPYVIVAKPGSFGSFENLIKKAKNEPGKINFASAGVGTGMHYLGELINSSTGVEMVHIPYSSGARQLQAVLADDVHIAIISLVTALPQIKAGNLEALAVSSTTRSVVAPDIPTLVESGLKEAPSVGAWIAMFAPKDTDPKVVESLSKQISAIAHDKAIRERVTSWGAEIPDTSVDHLKKVIQVEKQLWDRLIKENNLPVAS